MDSQNKIKNKYVAVKNVHTSQLNDFDTHVIRSHVRTFSMSFFCSINEKVVSRQSCSMFLKGICDTDVSVLHTM